MLWREKQKKEGMATGVLLGNNSLVGVDIRTGEVFNKLYLRSIIFVGIPIIF